MMQKLLVVFVLLLMQAPVWALAETQEEVSRFNTYLLMNNTSEQLSRFNTYLLMNNIAIQLSRFNNYAVVVTTAQMLSRFNTYAVVGPANTAKPKVLFMQ